MAPRGDLSSFLPASLLLPLLTFVILHLKSSPKNDVNKKNRGTFVRFLKRNSGKRQIYGQTETNVERTEAVGQLPSHRVLHESRLMVIVRKTYMPIQNNTVRYKTVVTSYNVRQDLHLQKIKQNLRDLQTPPGDSPCRARSAPKSPAQYP